MIKNNLQKNCKKDGWVIVACRNDATKPKKVIMIFGIKRKKKTFSVKQISIKI